MKRKTKTGFYEWFKQEYPDHFKMFHSIYRSDIDQGRF